MPNCSWTYSGNPAIYKDAFNKQMWRILSKNLNSSEDLELVKADDL